MISRNDKRKDFRGILKQFKTSQQNSISSDHDNIPQFNKTYMNPCTPNASGTNTTS